MPILWEPTHPERSIDSHRMSSAMLELRNLYNVAKEHKENCNSESCEVRLLLLKYTANRLLAYVWTTERTEAIHLLSDNHVWL